MIQLETKRLIMKSDLYIENGTIKSIQNKKIDLQNIPKRINGFQFYDKHNNNLICHIGMKFSRRCNEINYGTELEFRNQGYMSEALSAFIKWFFENTNETELNALVPNHNIYSQMLVKKCNFVEDGAFDNNTTCYILKK